jgi:hypothetical protein
MESTTSARPQRQATGACPEQEPDARHAALLQAVRGERLAGVPETLAFRRKQQRSRAYAVARRECRDAWKAIAGTGLSHVLTPARQRDVSEMSAGRGVLAVRSPLDTSKEGLA